MPENVKSLQKQCFYNFEINLAAISQCAKYLESSESILGDGLRSVEDTDTNNQTKEATPNRNFLNDRVLPMVMNNSENYLVFFFINMVKMQLFHNLSYQNKL